MSGGRGDRGGRTGWNGLRRVFRLGLVGGDSDRDVERELEFHFEEAVRRLMEGGMTESEAKAEARRRFGDEASYRKELRRMAKGRDRRVRWWETLASMGGSLGEAARNVRRSPGLAFAVILIMALGVGANATMFGILDGLFLSPPAHIDEPDEVKRFFVHIRRSTTGEIEPQRFLPYPDYRDWAELDVFDNTMTWSDRQLTVGHGPGAERLPVTLASASMFPMLGVEPVLGRFYGSADDQLGADPVAVLGYGYWQRAYGGDPSVLGEAVDAGDLTYTVIGVAPEGFTGVDKERVDLWVPLHRAALVEEGGTEWLESRGWYFLQAAARLADGVAEAEAEAAATTVHRAARADDEGYDPEATVHMAPLLIARTAVASREAMVVPWLVGVAVMVLLLTCANVANLLLARAMRRRRETAVRLALGVSRRRLVGTVVSEAVLLALLGGAAAVAVAVVAGDVLRAVLVPDGTWDAGGATTRVLVFSAGLAILAGLAAGLIPALRASRPDTTEALKGSGRSVTRGRSRLRSGLLVFQAAVSVVLLLGTGLFVQSLRAAQDVDLGFEPDRVLLARIQPAGGYPGGEAMTRLYREAEASVEGLAGVESTAITTVTPFRNSRSIGDDLRVPGLDSLPRTRSGGAYIHAVSGAYFETMGMRIVRGRGITESDDSESAPRVAVVNETFASLVWPDGDALGGCLLIREAPCATVVGIVEDHHRYDLVEDASMHYYVPLAKMPYPWPPSRLLIRSPAPGRLAQPVRRTLSEALPGARLVTTQPYRDVVDPAYRSWELGATLFAAFGLLALLVAAVGLYSVLAFDVAERRSELGVRAALGASRQRITRLVVGDGLRIAAIGIALGLAGGLYAANRATEILFDVSPFEPLTLLAVAAGMLLVAVLASGIPAWRAARVDAVEALKAE